MEIACKSCKAVNEYRDLDLLMGVIFEFVDKNKIKEARQMAMVNLQGKIFKGELGRIMGGRAELVITFDPDELLERQRKIEAMGAEA